MYRFRDTLPIDISRKTISGDLVTIDNSEEMGVVDSLEVSLSPIQDLNGYDKPWSGGAGKNKIPPKTGQAGIAQLILGDDATAIASASGVYLKSGTYTLSVNSTKTSNIYWYNVSSGANGRIGNTLAPRTVTVSADGYYFPFLYNSSGISSADVSTFQLEEGSSATAWTPYSNICPISGRTEVVTRVTGKNLLNLDRTLGTPNPSAGTNTTSPRVMDTEHYYVGLRHDNYYYPSNVAEYSVANNEVTVRGANNAYGVGFPIEVKPNTQYRVSATVDGSGYLGISYYDTEWNYISFVNDGPAFTTPSNASYAVILLRSLSTSATATWKNVQVELGSTATSYEPYQGTTYTTALGRTVYGGTLDVVSGVLTATHAMVDLGSLNWGLSDGIRARTRVIDYTREVASWSGDWHNTKSNVFSCEDPNLAYSARSDYSFANIPQNYYNFDIKVPSGVFADGTAVKNWLADIDGNGTHAYICIELATPQTYQLTPQQIELLVGENHVWSDGEISVVWHKDLTKGRILPTEAVSINGQYIENVLDGYRTLYTKGRESLGAELNTYSVGTSDGEKFKSKRYPARELTVGFQLIADNAEDFREKFNNLNNLLSLDEADFIFNDETDKFFSGYPIMNAEVGAGENSVKGEWKIYCAYPFKRSVEPITLTMEDATVTDTTATFTIDYKGARPARPVLRAKFAGAKSGGSSSEDGDCGFVAFMDGEENIIQLGNPEVLDLDEYTKAETLINKSFVNVSDWQSTGGHTYKGTVTGSVSTSNTTDTYWNGGRGQTQSYAKPSYGSGSGLHGAILWKNTAGAVNFTMHMVHRLCVSSANQTGVFECGAYNHDTGVMVAGFVIDKTSNGTAGVVRYIVNGIQVGSDSIDLSYYNTHFGYCNRTPVYVQQTYYDPVTETYRVQVKTKKKKKKKKKYVTKSRIVWVARTRTVFSNWNYTQSNLNSSIEKEGAYVYIKVGNLPLRTFNVPDVEQMIAHDASVFMGTYGTAMHTNMIHSLLFRREAGVPFAEQPNVFTAGDIVEADCSEATVNIYRDGSIGGHLEPQYGALGNDWESFMLTSGSNVIRATWSEWVNPTYKPQIEIEYNEVFI